MKTFRKRPSKPETRSMDKDDALSSFAHILEKSQATVNQVDVADHLNHAADSDEDDSTADTAAHKRLVTALGQLHRSQHIKVPTRTEISERRGEFDLVKSHADDVLKPIEAKVTLSGLVDSLNKNQKHAEVSKELTKLQKNSKKLAKPLEKPTADRLARTLAYEKAVSELDKWETVVEKNKVEETIHFPLIDEQAVRVAETTPREPLSYRIKSTLMTELAKLDPVQPVLRPAEQAERNKRLKQELREQRKELARLKRKESYEIEKAKRQNKIKSKKYHRVLKKEKLRKQLAEFEELKKTDPEAVLVELEKIEKARVEERAHQRHRNTGTWAKNLQVRAKFDREAREELTQQIEIGKELTRKQVDEEDSDDGEAAEEEETTIGGQFSDPFNPWMKASENEGENEEFSGYRKYWEERNNAEEKMKEFMAADEEEEEEEDSDSEEEEEDEDPKKPNIVQQLDNGFEVSTLDEIFEPLEDGDVIEEKVTVKLQKLRKAAGLDKRRNNKQQKNGNEDPEERESKGLEFKKKARLGDADNQLEESAAEHRGGGAGNTDDVKSLKDLLAKKSIEEEKQQENDQTAAGQINPNKFMALEPRQLKTALPDAWNDEEVESGGEDGDGEREEADAQRMTIAEAFEDDDIVMDFKQEKEERNKADQVEDVNLTLPGWGAWTGDGVKPRKNKKKKRMILRFPKQLPRKDDNKEKLILNETVPEKLKEHLVNDLPFPFRTVADYESSIRAPISRTFVPETAHRALTVPSVTTRMGKVIEPMDEHTLMQSEMPSGKRRTKSSHKLADASKKKKLQMKV